MDVSLKKISSNEIELEIEIPSSAMENYFQLAASSLSKDMKINGFRPGKVPIEIVEQKIGSQKLFDEATNLAVYRTLPEAIRDNDIEIVGQPEISVTQIARGNPMKYKAKVWIIPEIELANYKGLEIKKNKTSVEQEEVDKSLEYLKKSRAKLITVNRPAEKGDRVEIDFVAKINGVKMEGGESKNHPLIIGENRFIPGFEQKLEGMSEKEEKKFSLIIPDDWPQKNIANKNLGFEVKMNLVQKREEPELSDEFAIGLGDFKSLEQLKTNIREGIFQEKEQKEKERIRMELLEEVAKNSQITVPETLINIELNKMVDELKLNIKNMGMDFDAYLQNLKKTIEDLKKDWRKNAEKRVKIALVLREIAKKENITADEEEVSKKANEFLSAYANTEEAKKDIDPEELKDYAKSVIKNEKVFQLLEREATLSVAKQK